jgi:hypothetical protein
VERPVEEGEMGCVFGIEMDVFFDELVLEKPVERLVYGFNRSEANKT